MIPLAKKKNFSVSCLVELLAFFLSFCTEESRQVKHYLQIVFEKNTTLKHFKLWL